MERYLLELFNTVAVCFLLERDLRYEMEREEIKQFLFDFWESSVRSSLGEEAESEEMQKKLTKIRTLLDAMITWKDDE